MDFLAIPRPANAQWPDGKPVWGGASGSGNQATRIYDTAGQFWVTAECENVVTGAIVAVEVAELQYRIGTNAFAAMPDLLCVTKDTTVDFRAIPNPPGNWPSGKPVWTGADGGDDGNASFTYNTSGTNYLLTVECGNVLKGVVWVISNYTIIPSSRFICLSNTVTAEAWTVDESGAAVKTNSDWTILEGVERVAFVDGAMHTHTMNNVSEVTIIGENISAALDDVKVHAHAIGNESLTDDEWFTVIKVELQDGANVVNDNGYVYINSMPQMPQITASLKPDGLSGNAKWRLHIEYKRNPRNDDEYYPVPTAASWKTLLAEEVWNIADEFGTDFRGGKATLYCEYQGLEFEQIFHIRGNNPTEAAAEAEIGNNPWYAIPIARHESGTQNGRTYVQFNEVGALGPNPADFKHCPNFGDPNGWGIMQLDPPPSDETLWNWKQNIADGKAHLANPCHTTAAAWIANQEAQQQAEEPCMPLENYIFTFNGVDFQKGTDRTPVDACTIQRYNGAALWVIYWKNKTPTESGIWQIRNTHRAYVDSVCDEIDLEKP